MIGHVQSLSMQCKAFAILILISIIHRCDCRTISIHNESKETLWIGTWGFVNNCATLYKLGGGGFVLPSGGVKKLEVPNDYCSGRIWARTGCKTVNGIFRCDTGDCGPSVECTTTGSPPATLVEMTMERDRTVKYDTYDISIVDGFNVGVSVKPVGGSKVNKNSKSKYECGAPKCGTPKLPFKKSSCPKELRSLDGKHCLSICQAVSVPGSTQDHSFVKSFDKNLVCCECGCGDNCGCDDGKNDACRFGCSPLHPTTSPYNYQWKGVCDSKKWPESSTKTSYPEIFKTQCPDAYSWQFDDEKSTYVCRDSDYVITFYDGMK